jgi:integrase
LKKLLHAQREVRPIRVLPVIQVSFRSVRGVQTPPLEWARIDPDASPQWQQKRLSMARIFARYVHAYEPRTEIPAQQLLVTPHPLRYVPYVFSDADVQALMSAARRLGGLIGATTATVLGLLATTGMRFGEAVGLDQGDIDWQRKLLIVRGAKFGKSRQVPLHGTTLAALRRYARLRDQAFSSPRCEAFFVSATGMRVLHQNFHQRFLKLLNETGLAKAHVRRPRIHDLRHSFVIAALVRWQRAGIDVEQRLPALSTYVGHVSPSSTYWYLSATKELLEAAARRLERARRAKP